MINGRGEQGESELQRSILAKNREIQQQILAVDTADDSLQRLLLEELERHPNKAALVDVLKEISQQTLSLQQIPSFENEQQMVRLDSMLASEGVTRPENPIIFPNIGESAADQREYQEKISILRKIYQEEMAAYEKACQEFKDPVLSLLEQQSTLRPVSQVEKELLLANIQHRFQGIQLQLKDSICQAIVILRNRIFDVRRKRQNFTKAATVILNEYFYNNLANPYPNEQVKEELAAKCNLSVAQVTNWFGNKRIRFKKSYVKSEDELNVEETHETKYSETQFTDTPFTEANPEKDMTMRDSNNVDGGI